MQMHKMDIICIYTCSLELFCFLYVTCYILFLWMPLLTTVQIINQNVCIEKFYSVIFDTINRDSVIEIVHSLVSGSSQQVPAYYRGIDVPATLIRRVLQFIMWSTQIQSFLSDYFNTSNRNPSKV